MSLILKMLIIVNMDLIIERGLGYGITLQLGNLENYVKRIVATSGIINILKLRRDCHKKAKPTGGKTPSFIHRVIYIEYHPN